MENDGWFSVPVDMADRNSVAMDRIASMRIANSHPHFDSFDLKNQNQTLSEYTMLPPLQGEPVSDLHANIQLANRASVMYSDALVTTSLGMNAVGDAPPGCSRSIADSDLGEQFLGGTPISGEALAALLATRSGIQENLNNLAISGPLSYPLEELRPFASTDCSNALNSPFASSVNYGCDGVLYGNINCREDYDRFPTTVVLGERSPIRAGFQPYSSITNLQPTTWMSSNGVNVSADNPFPSGRFNNELSLSLATTQPSVNGTSIPDQCSEINREEVTNHCSKETRLGSEQTSCSSKELSLSCNSYRAGQFSQVISGSQYLHVIQEILAQIASYSLENLDLTSSSTVGIKTGARTQFSSSYPTEVGMPSMGSDESPDAVEGRFEVQMDPALLKRALEAKRTQLLALLQVVDERYSQCLDEIHTVISAFHAATELNPQIHTRFALQTISFLYKRLRERISNQILAMGAHLDSGDGGETDGSFDTSYFQKQWTLQQLKKKDHQLWKPQRGLPERSVSVLRAWMFQNFLHPYPKDAEKHLLAVKSGLTRSQVSNWFINARVRLWKPMIEEMYAEMNRRKARQNEEGSNSNHRGQISISNPRFSVN